MSYDAEAKRIANSIHCRRFETTRGVIPGHEPGISVLFGNDQYASDPRTRELVRLLLAAASAAGTEVLSFATNDGEADAGCTWALLVSADLEWAKARLHDAYLESHRLDAQLATATAPSSDSSDSSSNGSPAMATGVVRRPRNFTLFVKPQRPQAPR